MRLMCLPCRSLWLIAVVVFVVGWSAGASAQLRIATWNVLDGPTNSTADADFRTVLDAIAGYEVNGIAKPLDVLALQETDDAQANRVVNILNGLTPGSDYGVYSNSASRDEVALIYNRSTLEVLDQRIVSGDPRPAARVQLRPIGYTGDENVLTFYSFHLKAGGSDSDFVRRGNTAAGYRADADALGQGANVAFLGDYNIRSSNEGGYANFAAPGNAQAFDPVNRPGTYKNNPAFADVHTHSTSDVDDRFDLQLFTGELLDGEGLSYIGPSAPGTGGQHSYWAFGNSGNLYNQPITNSSALPSNVLTALRNASDHLPVIADIQLPARAGLTATSSAPGDQVFVGGIAGVFADVLNTAPVTAVAAADELDYAVTADGDAVNPGTFGGSLNARTPSTRHLFEFDTATAGRKTLDVQLDALSQGADDVNQVVTLDVFDHANGSFASGSDVNTLTIDFGTLTQGAGNVSAPSRWFESFDVFNLDATPGFTSALSFEGLRSTAGEDNILALVSAPDVGDTAVAGEGFELAAAFNTSLLGEFSATWEIEVGDALDIAGALTETLTLTLLGEVLAAGFIDGDYNGDGTVGQADLDLVLQNWGSSELPAEWLAVDQFQTALISGAELDGVLLNWGDTASSNVAIPEPTSAAGLVALGGLLGRRRCGRDARAV